MNVIEETPQPEVEVPDVDTAQKPQALRVVDRCDGCSAQAYVSVSMGDALLLFCGHDYAKHEPALTAAGGVVVEDARKQLLVKPAV